MTLDDAAFQFRLEIIFGGFTKAPYTFPPCTLLAMATSVLLESLRLLLLFKTATFSISNTSVTQDLNAQHACHEAQDLCWTIIGALE